MRKLIVAGLMAGVVLPLAPAAYAQESAETGISQDEIIVTARRREESLSKVPIAITAIGGEELEKRAIFNENDLQSAVPGLVIRQNGGVHAFNYSIRGQSVDTFTNSPPSVLPYVNEVQIVTHNASTFRSIRFSMICICRSTSTSRSAACTTSVTPSRFAASSAPCCISMKNGLFNVFTTSATVG